MASNKKMKKGILGVGYKLIGTENASIKWLVSAEAGGRAYSAEPRGENSEVYADSVKVYGDTINDGYDITLTLLDVIDDVNADWLNEQVDDKGRAEYADGKEYPYFELYIIENTVDGVGKTTIYYYCQCSGRPSASGATKEGATAFDFQFPEYPIAATPRPTDMLVKYTIDGKERFTATPEPTTTGD